MSDDRKRRAQVINTQNCPHLSQYDNIIDEDNLDLPPLTLRECIGEENIPPDEILNIDPFSAITSEEENDSGTESDSQSDDSENESDSESDDSGSSAILVSDNSDVWSNIVWTRHQNNEDKCQCCRSLYLQDSHVHNCQKCCHDECCLSHDCVKIRHIRHMFW